MSRPLAPFLLTIGVGFMVVAAQRTEVKPVRVSGAPLPNRRSDNRVRAALARPET